MKRISQRQARANAKELEALQRDNRSRMARWGADWPGGVHLETLILHEIDAARIDTARALGRAIVLRPEGRDNRYMVYAVEGLR